MVSINFVEIQYLRDQCESLSKECRALSDRLGEAFDAFDWAQRVVGESTKYSHTLIMAELVRIGRGKGMKTKEIAQKLGISTASVLAVPYGRKK